MCSSDLLQLPWKFNIQLMFEDGNLFLELFLDMFGHSLLNHLKCFDWDYTLMHGVG